jgi:hypothetical protein
MRSSGGAKFELCEVVPNSRLGVSMVESVVEFVLLMGGRYIIVEGLFRKSINIRGCEGGAERQAEPELEVNRGVNWATRLGWDRVYERTST